MDYRPEGWKNPYPSPDAEVLTIEHLIVALNGVKSDYEVYEEGANAILNAIWEMANKSPTKTFTFDANANITY